MDFVIEGGLSGFDSGVSIKIAPSDLFICPGDGMEIAGSLETSFYITRRGRVLEEGYILLVINTVHKSFCHLRMMLKLSRGMTLLMFQLRTTVRTLLFL
jgi:hypothetical protein